MAQQPTPDHYLSEQEIFDAVWHHFITEGNPRSLRDLNIGTPEGTPWEERETRCAYRGHDGTRCAIGVLIDDTEYDPLMEDIGDVNDLAAEGMLPRRLQFVQKPFLLDLQAAHDSNGVPETLCNAALVDSLVEEVAGLENGLRAIAHYYGLTIPGSDS